MSIRTNFQLRGNAPSTPVEQDTRSDDASNSVPSPSNSVPSPSTSTQSSPESFDQHSLACESHWQNRRNTPRRKCALRNIEKRPYHLPTHISPPHDAPMTKNDLYFALDCEVSNLTMKINFIMCFTCVLNFLILFQHRWLA
jgi:hypothetical protein